VTEHDTCTPGQTNPLTVVGLDPVYGQPTFSIQAAGIKVGNQLVYCYGNGDAPQIAVRGDGAVIVSEPTNNGFLPLTMVYPGGEAAYPIPTSTNTTTAAGTINVQCCMGPPMVNSDGTAYVEYEVRNVVDNLITSDTLYLFHINPDNSYGSTVLSTTTQNQALLPGPIVPDGNWGVGNLDHFTIESPGAAVSLSGSGCGLWGGRDAVQLAVQSDEGSVWAVADAGPGREWRGVRKRTDHRRRWRYPSQPDRLVQHHLRRCELDVPDDGRK
jgi:hypothetical protein